VALVGRRADRSAVTEEMARINGELERVTAKADFALQILPVAPATSPEAAEKLAAQDQDVTLVYACTGSGTLLRACLGGKAHALVFVRHRNGPVYYWYEALSTRYLRTDSLVRHRRRMRARRACTWTTCGG